MDFDPRIEWKINALEYKLPRTSLVHIDQLSIQYSLHLPLCPAWIFLVVIALIFMDYSLRNSLLYYWIALFDHNVSFIFCFMALNLLLDLILNFQIKMLGLSHLELLLSLNRFLPFRSTSRVCVQLDRHFSIASWRRGFTQSHSQDHLLVRSPLKGRRTSGCFRTSFDLYFW